VPLPKTYPSATLLRQGRHRRRWRLRSCRLCAQCMPFTKAVSSKTLSSVPSISSVCDSGRGGGAYLCTSRLGGMLTQGRLAGHERGGERSSPRAVAAAGGIVCASAARLRGALGNARQKETPSGISSAQSLSPVCARNTRRGHKTRTLFAGDTSRRQLDRGRHYHFNNMGNIWVPIKSRRLTRERRRKPEGRKWRRQRGT